MPATSTPQTSSTRFVQRQYPHAPGLDADASQVLHHDAERGLTYTWHDVSPCNTDMSPREQAIETSVLNVTNAAGERVGYLKVSFSTAAFVKAAFNRPLEFGEHQGRLVGINSHKHGYGAAQTLAQLWVKAHFAYGVIPPSLGATGFRDGYWSLSEKHATFDDKTMKADLALLEKPIAKQMRAWTRFFAVPFVAYASVNEDHRGTGVGRQMYLLTARHLATQGKVLRGSGLQSDLAEALWARLAADPGVPVKNITLTNPTTGERKTYQALDYR